MSARRREGIKKEATICHLRNSRRLRKDSSAFTEWFLCHRWLLLKLEGLYLRAHLLQMERSSQERFRTPSRECKHRHRSLDNHHPKYTLLFGERCEPRDSLIGEASFFSIFHPYLMLCADRSLLKHSQFEREQQPKIITFPLRMFAVWNLGTQMRLFELDCVLDFSLISESGMVKASWDKSQLLFKTLLTTFKR